ncbi:MAG: TetR/AcrR family transcriptional regulator [Candidatus Cloacimonetes bacterium]|nr:TetR/AcrR family transcriptional regulator [Candidatus Cloacimonadota bacterium]
MTRKEREMLRRKNDIIEAAHDLFLEKGYEEVSMAEIAERAEFTRRTLYSYFNGKRDLVVEVIIQAFAKESEKFESVMVSAVDNYQKLKGLATCYYEFFKETPAYYLLMQQFDLAVHNERDKLHETVIKDLQGFKPGLDGMAEQIIKSGIADGTFYSDLNPGLAATYLWKSLYGIVHQYILHELYPEDHYFIEVAYLLRGITVDPECFRERI